MLERFYKNKEEILKKTQNNFLNSSSLIPKIGCELEFFLLEKNGQALEKQGLLLDLISELKAELKKKFSLIYEVEKEQGVSQIEIKTSFTADLYELCRQISDAKNFVKNFAEEKNLQASFAAQPFENDCGSALQFNISFHDEVGKNDETIFKNIAAKLLSSTNEMMIFLSPKIEDYARFSYELNRDLFRRGKFTAPINLSFGADNRTCAIRIAKGETGKRLEYRVAASDADLFLTTSAILLAMIRNEKSQFEQIHGNAFDEQYCVKDLCKNLEEAEKVFVKGNFLYDSFNKMILSA